MRSGGGTGHQTFAYDVVMVRQPDRGSRSMSMSGHPKDGCLPQILLVLVVLCVCSLHPLTSSIQQSFSVELCILLVFFFSIFLFPGRMFSK